MSSKDFTKITLLILDEIKNKIKNGEINLDLIKELIIEAQKGTSESIINKNDYINADKAMNILHLGKNRAKFFKLLKQNNIKTHKINNMPIGYKKNDIISLSVKSIDSELNKKQ